MLKRVPVHFLDGCTTLEIFDLRDNPLTTSVAIETFDISIIENKILKAMISHLLLYWANLLTLSATKEIKQILFQWYAKEFDNDSYSSLDLMTDHLRVETLLRDLALLLSFWLYIPAAVSAPVKVSMFNAFLRSKQAAHPSSKIDELFFRNSVEPVLSVLMPLPQGSTEEGKIEIKKKLHARDDEPAGLRIATESKKQRPPNDSDLLSK